jgi:hypothetical protein
MHTYMYIRSIYRSNIDLIIYLLYLFVQFSFYLFEPILSYLIYIVYIHGCGSKLPLDRSTMFWTDGTMAGHKGPCSGYGLQTFRE